MQLIFLSLKCLQSFNISTVTDLTCGVPQFCMGLVVATVIHRWYFGLDLSIQRGWLTVLKFMGVCNEEFHLSSWAFLMRIQWVHYS